MNNYCGFIEVYTDFANGTFQYQTPQPIEFLKSDLEKTIKLRLCTVAIFKIKLK